MRGSSQPDRQHLFLRLWLFQIGELTSQQRRIHEMTAPVAQLPANKRVIAAKKYQFHFGAYAGIRTGG